MVDGIELQRQEQAREEAEEVSKLWYWLLPLLSWFFITTIFLVLQLSLDSFIKWWQLVVVSLVVGVFGQVIGWAIYFYKRSQKAEVQTSVPFLKPKEFTQYCIDYKKTDLNNPVNLALWQGDRGFETMMTVGGNGQGGATEVYVRKFWDVAVTNTDFYFAFARVHQPDTVSWVRVGNEPSEDAEEKLIKYHAENLALTPARYRESQTITNSPFTGVETIQTVREPYSVQVQGGQQKLEREEIKEE